MEEIYAVYVRADATGRIVEINSGAFLQDTAGWVKVDEGTGDRYHHAQGNYLCSPLRDGNGICRYKLVDGKALERSQAEIDADAAAQPGQEPSEVETIMELVLDQEQRICMFEMGAE